MVRYRVLMVGGVADGRILEVPENADEWRVPVPHRAGVHDLDLPLMPPSADRYRIVHAEGPTETRAWLAQGYSAIGILDEG